MPDHTHGPMPLTHATCPPTRASPLRSDGWLNSPFCPCGNDGRQPAPMVSEPIDTKPIVPPSLPAHRTSMCGFASSPTIAKSATVPPAHTGQGPVRISIGIRVAGSHGPPASVVQKAKLVG